MPDKQDSNATATYIAEEETPKTLPVTPIWYEQEPNSFNDFGGEISSVARDTINVSRQRKRGTITDLDVSGGYNTDVTQNNLNELMQGFMFADIHAKTELPSATVTASGSLYTVAPTLGAEIVTNGAFATDTSWTKGAGWTIAAGVATATGGISTALSQTSGTTLVQGRSYQVVYTATRSAGSVTVSLGGTNGTARSTSATFTEVIVAGATQTIAFTGTGFTGTIDDASIKIIAVDELLRVGDLVLAKDFDLAANNGLRRVTSVPSALSIGVAETIVDASTQTGQLVAVGFQFASGDATMTVTSGVATLGATAKDLTQLGLNVGEFVFLGGDSSATKFATCPVGYGRVKSISATAIVFDKVTSTFVTDAGAGKTVQIFFGKFLRNESAAASIITRTYAIERQLGNDGVGVQAEYLRGAVANEFSLNIPMADKLNADLAYIAMDHDFVTGTEGIESGTRVAAGGESCFNTSSDVYRLRMSVIDAATLEPSALYAYVTKADIKIKNNAEINKAVGTLGGFSVSVGNFEVSGSVEAYFSNVTAVQAVRNNSDVTFDAILAKANAGIVYDLPMLGLGGGRLNVEKDKAIMVPLETLAAEGTEGYTLGISFLPYLPTAAMPA